jgi:hypothetical protein
VLLSLHFGVLFNSVFLNSTYVLRVPLNSAFLVGIKTSSFAATDYWSTIWLMDSC